MQPEAPEPKQSTIKTLLKRAWHSLRRHPFQKLAAVLLAFAFWAIVIASDSTRMIDKTLTNVPVTVNGQDSLRINKGLIVMDDFEELADGIKLRVEVQQGRYAEVTSDTFIPRLELGAQINEAGENQRVYFTASANSYGSVMTFEPEYIEVDVEPYKSRNRVPIVVEQVGQTNEPLWISTPTFDPSQVTVAGPETQVNRVFRAVVKLPLGGLSTSRPVDSLSAVLELQDANGNVVTSPMLRVTSDSLPVDSAVINVNVYPMRDIPVDLDSAITGIPAHGYTVSDIRIVPDTIAVAADQDILDEIEALFIGSPLDISGRTEGTVQTKALRTLSDVAHMAATEVSVEVDIVPATHVHTYINLPVTVMGLDPTLTAKVSHPEMDVVIRGDYDKVQGLKQADISLFVNVAGLEEGVHMLEVQCIVNGTDSFTFEPELPSVTVTLTKTDPAG